MRSASAIAVMLLIAFGCDGGPSTSAPATAPAGNLVFRDASGNVVATADVELPATLPAADGTFKGNWRLLSSEPAFPSRSTKSGGYEGSVSGGLASIDLNPGMADNNVVLMWSSGAEPITGTWYHATVSGGKAMGTFSLARPGDVR
jgi:hypothetical protein